MAFSVEDRLKALRNRLKRRGEMASSMPQENDPPRPSLDEMLKRIQAETRKVPEPALDDAE